MLKGFGPQRQQQESKKQPLGEVGRTGEGGPAAPLVRWAHEGLGSRQLGGALGGMVDLRAPTYLVPAMFPLFHTSYQTLATTGRAGVAISILQRRLNEVLPIDQCDEVPKWTT